MPEDLERRSMMLIETCRACTHHEAVDMFEVCLITVKHDSDRLTVKHCVDVKPEECRFEGK